MKFALRWMSWIGICLAATVTAWAQAENYPSRTITVVVPFPAGGLTDVPMRLAASLLQEKIGQPVVIEHRTGASGTIGAAYVTRATPDGYTLHANSIGDAQNIHFMPLSYHPVDDFAMIGWIVDGPPLILAIDAKLPIKTVAELIADAKANPSKYSFATSGPASSPNATLARFNAAAGTRSRRCIIAVPARRRPPLPPAQFKAPSRTSRRARRWLTAASSGPWRSLAPGAWRFGRTFRPCLSWA